MIIHVLVAVVIMYSDLSGPVSIGLQGMNVVNIHL